MRVFVLSDDHELRLELRNLLLSAGCSEVVLAGGRREPPESRETGVEPELAIVDGALRSRWAVASLARLCRRKTALRVVVLIEPGSERALPDRVARLCRIEYTLKITFAQSLRSFLHPEES